MKNGFWTGRIAVALAACLAIGGVTAAQAAEHGGMAGMQHGGGSAAPAAHDMTKMGDKVYDGKLGTWKASVRLMDMKAHMAAMPSGMKMEGAMPNSHHIAVSLSDAKTKKAIVEGTGKVTVTGPDKKAVASDFMVMQGHFGADVNLPKPGKYTFKVEIASGTDKGSATFSYKVK
jgi:hypothetical protein